MLYYGIVPTIAVLALPFFILLAAATGLSLSLWLSALNAQYRDIRYVVPFLLQLWLFLTPVAYFGNLVPERWQTLYGLNPMAGVIEGFRWALLGQDRASWNGRGCLAAARSAPSTGGHGSARRAWARRLSDASSVAHSTRCPSARSERRSRAGAGSAENREVSYALSTCSVVGRFRR